jgi:hypothetical protein
MVREAAAGVTAAGGGAPGTLFMSQLSEEAGVNVVVTWAAPRWQKVAGGGSEEFRAALAASYPSLPETWAEQV